MACDSIADGSIYEMRNEKWFLWQNLPLKCMTRTYTDNSSDKSALEVTSDEKKKRKRKVKMIQKM